MDDKMKEESLVPKKGFVEYKQYDAIIEDIKKIRDDIARINQQRREVITEDEAHHIKYHLGQAMAIIRCNLNAYEKRKR